MSKSNIEAERGRLRLTKEEISRLLGISSKTYLAYTRGKPIPSPVLLKMAGLFECTVDYLLGVESPSKKKGT